MRLFAEVRLEAGERTAAQRGHAAYFMIVAAAGDDLYLQGGESLKKALALFDAEWVNFQAGQVWAAAHASKDDAAAKLCNAFPDAGAYCLALRQHPRDGIRWLEAALAAARQLKNRGAEGAHLGNLGLAYFSLGGSRRAVEYYEQALAISREIGGWRGEGQVLGNLGNAYHSLGEYRRAIDYHEQRLKIAREIGDRRGEGNALGNLGLAYDSLGEYRRAIEYHELNLQIAREIGDQRGEGNALWNMSLAFDMLGERAQAIAHAETALKILEQIESPNAARVRAQLVAWRREGEGRGHSAG